MNIRLICIGNIKEKFNIQAIEEFSKRLNAYVNFEIIELDEVKLPNKPSEAQIRDGLEKEAENILKKIRDRSYIICLAIEGKQLDSVKFSEKIQKLAIDGYSDIVFIIGSSYGLSEKIKNKSNFKLSFSKMTFPHQLMRVILVEQIYRAFKIMKNEAYHK